MEMPPPKCLQVAIQQISQFFLCFYHFQFIPETATRCWICWTCTSRPRGEIAWRSLLCHVIAPQITSSFVWKTIWNMYIYVTFDVLLSIFEFAIKFRFFQGPLGDPQIRWAYVNTLCYRFSWITMRDSNVYIYIYILYIHIYVYIYTYSLHSFAVVLHILLLAGYPVSQIRNR